MPPALVTIAARPMGFDDTIWSGPGVVPGGTSSSPVARMATTGLRRTASVSCPMAAASVSACASRLRPLRRSIWPCVKSTPRARTLAIGFAGSRTITSSPSRSVFSWMTTVSAPSGSGAPVKMRTASRAASRPRWPRPAADVADDLEARRNGGEIGRLYRVAVHGGRREWRLRELGRDILRQHAVRRVENRKWFRARSA